MRTTQRTMLALLLSSTFAFAAINTDFDQILNGK